MNKAKLRIILNTLVVLPGAAVLCPGCATICGGAKYNAHIAVYNRPAAAIRYQGQKIGYGSVIIPVKRKEANQFAFTVQDGDCPEKEYRFKSRIFRGWSLAGSILGWSSLAGFIPVGVGVDLATGAYWKPDVQERGVTKLDYKNFRYSVDYGSCTPSDTARGTGTVDVIYLRNGTVIKGTLIENQPGIQVQIRTESGDVQLYLFSEIDRLGRETKTP